MCFIAMEPCQEARPEIGGGAHQWMSECRFVEYYFLGKELAIPERKVPFDKFLKKRNPFF